MKIRLIAGMAAAALCSAPALIQAAPPTVVPSPGYDARLQEQRAAANRAAAIVAPAKPPVTHRSRKHRYAN